MNDRSGSLEYKALLRRVAELEARNRRQRKFWLAGAVLACLAVGSPALAELIELRAGTPARAGDINANFREVAELAANAAAIGENAAVSAAEANDELRDQLEAKVGPVGQPLMIAGTLLTRFEVTGEVYVEIHAPLSNGWGGESYKDLIPEGDGICMLTQNVSVEATLPEHDRSDDGLTHRCRVVQEAGMWRVKAGLSRAYHQYTDLWQGCSARCLRWK